MRDIGGWRGETLARMRALILEADPEMIEEVKWRKPSNGMAGVPVWSHDGIVCTGETYKKVVKLTFAQGASLPDPSRLFNSSLEGNTRRAIDIHEGREDRRARVQGAREGRGGPEQRGEESGSAMRCWRLSVVLAALLFANGCRSRTPDAAELAGR